MNSNLRLLPIRLLTKTQEVLPIQSASTSPVSPNQNEQTHCGEYRRGAYRRGAYRRGVSAVEFAMVAPVFVIVVAICGEAARLSMMRNVAQNAAYEAARFTMTDGATVSDGIAKAHEILNRVGTANAVVTINGSDGVPDENGNVENEIGFSTTAITCAIEIPLSANSSIIPSYIFGETKIRSNMTVRTERYRGYYDGVSTQ